MALTENLVYELKVLKLYELSNLQEGIKVHHDAHPGLVQATERLFAKGLISLQDGGYLTELGLVALEHLEALHSILTTEPLLERVRERSIS